MQRSMKDTENKPKPGRPIRLPGDVPTEEKIFTAAIDLFAERGYAGTSMREIAREVGVTEGAVYKHYRSKDAILVAIFEHLETEIYRPLPPPPSPGLSIFRDLLETLPDYLLANPRMVKISRIMMNEMHSNRTIRDYLHEAFGSRSDSYTESILKAEIDGGRIRSCDPHALTVLLNAFRFGWVYRNFILGEDGPFDAESIRKEMLDAIALLEAGYVLAGTREPGRSSTG
jgi:AcrR family transcriptional regulator